MTTEQIALVRRQLYTLLGIVRKECVSLVDAFDIPDGILNSVLGRYDGDVYTHLYEWALKAPRNKKQVSWLGPVVQWLWALAYLNCVILILTLSGRA